MSNQAILKMNVTYLLDTLAGFKPEDIEDGSFDVAVNDDQFGQCSIVVLAAAASTRIKELEFENAEALKMINWQHKLDAARETVTPETFQQMYQGEFKLDARMEALRNRYIQYYKETDSCNMHMAMVLGRELKAWILRNGYTSKERAQIKKSLSSINISKS